MSICHLLNQINYFCTFVWPNTLLFSPKHKVGYMTMTMFTTVNCIPVLHFCGCPTYTFSFHKYCHFAKWLQKYNFHIHIFRKALRVLLLQKGPERAHAAERPWETSWCRKSMSGLIVQNSPERPHGAESPWEASWCRKAMRGLMLQKGLERLGSCCGKALEGLMLQKVHERPHAAESPWEASCCRKSMGYLL